ncbi:MAG: ketoacyl-ACP synthase III [Acidobacteriota bacterium]|nr:ketoacyl-ACP synthase III [Acidobacteriota bacterium]
MVTNDELAPKLDTTPQWILDVSGIEQRRFAGANETVADLAVAAARDCLRNAGLAVADIGMLIVASGSSERRFPGPAAATAHGLGLGEGVPAIDLAMASAGSLFGLSLASRLASVYGNVLVVGAEKMSTVLLREPLERGVAALFGDGAGACIVSARGGIIRLVDSVLHSDGAFAEDLKLEFEAPLAMNGRSVILRASRKIPAAISEVLARNRVTPAEVEVFLMHQANQNLIIRVAKALGLEPDKFYSNIRRYGNTSSASMFIAAAEWWSTGQIAAGRPVCFAAFGAGFHWGAVLAETQS